MKPSGVIALVAAGVVIGGGVATYELTRPSSEPLQVNYVDPAATVEPTTEPTVASVTPTTTTTTASKTVAVTSSSTTRTATVRKEATVSKDTAAVASSTTSATTTTPPQPPAPPVKWGPNGPPPNPSDSPVK